VAADQLDTHVQEMLAAFVATQSRCHQSTVST
jgi:hypothetical protein